MAETTLEEVTNYVGETAKVLVRFAELVALSAAFEVAAGISDNLVIEALAMVLLLITVGYAGSMTGYGIGYLAGRYLDNERLKRTVSLVFILVSGITSLMVVLEIGEVVSEFALIGMASD